MKSIRIGYLLLAVLPALAQADERWTCGYQPAHEPAITCVRAQDATVGGEAGASPAWAPATANGTFAQWEKVMIPLHAAPRDLSRLPVLARDVMCGRRAACDVEYIDGRVLQARLGTP